jgi:SWI/SNF-related matrix-associated actin-dependent regulator 1 of chromatin subfamily A
MEVLDNNEINISFDIPEKKAITILETYEGANNFIFNLKSRLSGNKNYVPTRAQCEYIINHHNVTPKVAKKWVELDVYFGQKVADERLFTETPKEVWVEKLLVETDKAYHIWGKFFNSENLYDFWLPKGALIKTPKLEKVDVDYTKYEHRPPLSHQKEAIEKLATSRRFILADDMGLGKTTATVIAALETGAKKILIICPASLKINWQREVNLYTDRSVFIAEGKKFSLEDDFVIVNYDILKNFYSLEDKENSLITQAKFDLVIIDEAHYIQNIKATRTKLVNSFSKNIKYLWLLTGTPMTSRPMNYFNLLQLVESPVAQNWMAYAIRYCKGYQFKIKGKKVWNVAGSSNLEELRDRTSKQFLRRLKTDILDLPDKIITPIYLRLKSKEYEDLLGEYLDWYNAKKDESSSLTVSFSKLMAVRQIIAQEKINSTIELAQNIIDQDKKVIIFTNFTDTLQKIYQHFGKEAVYLDGTCTKAKRQDAVDKFQESDKIKVFVGNLKAAGVGLTLTASEAVIMNDLSFVPSDHQQAEDRAYRYGQKNSVSVFYPIFENTIEGIIYDILSNKKMVIDTVMGDNIDRSEVVVEFMKRIKEL